jgi:hypothetical protein
MRVEVPEKPERNLIYFDTAYFPPVSRYKPGLCTKIYLVCSVPQEVVSTDLTEQELERKSGTRVSKEYVGSSVMEILI